MARVSATGWSASTSVVAPSVAAVLPVTSNSIRCHSFIMACTPRRAVWNAPDTSAFASRKVWFVTSICWFVIWMSRFQACSRLASAAVSSASLVALAASAAVRSARSVALT